MAVRSVWREWWWEEGGIGKRKEGKKKEGEFFVVESFDLDLERKKVKKINGKKNSHLLHLVELVDAADAAVGQHQRSALEHGLARHRVARHGRGQPDPARPPPRRVDRPRRQVRHVLEQLALGHPGVPHQADVDVPAQPHPVRQGAGDPSHQGEKQGLFHVAVAEDFGGEGPGEPVVDVCRGRGCINGLRQGGVLCGGGVALLVVLDARRFQEGFRKQRRRTGSAVAAAAHQPWHGGFG
jgi:hypothetical protein